MPTPFVLVGSQLGSLNSLAYARSHPQQVAQVVLIDPITNSIFEENNKDSESGSDNQQISWRKFWIKKQMPFSRLLQTTALLGINRIAILLGFLDVPGVNHDNTGSEESTSKENIAPNIHSNDDYETIAAMRLNHFMTDPSHLGAAAVELGTLNHPKSKSLMHIHILFGLML